jgi:hypothetical protein
MMGGWRRPSVATDRSVALGETPASGLTWEPDDRRDAVANEGASARRATFRNSRARRISSGSTRRAGQALEDRMAAGCHGSPPGDSSGAAWPARRRSSPGRCGRASRSGGPARPRELPRRCMRSPWTTGTDFHHAALPAGRLARPVASRLRASVRRHEFSIDATSSPRRTGDCALTGRPGLSGSAPRSAARSR